MQKGETLRWTSYCDECVRILQQEREAPSDLVLTQLAKLRLIALKTLDLSLSEDGTTLPTAFYMQSLQARLRDFKRTNPSELHNNRALLLELHNTELTVHELAMTTASFEGNT